MAMKWKRKSAGVYTSGEWAIKGSGTNWSLYYGGGLLDRFDSKKDAKAHAESAPDGAEEPEEAPAPRRGAQPEMGLDSTLRSLRLEIGQLSDQILALTAAVNRLTAALE